MSNVMHQCFMRQFTRLLFTWLAKWKNKMSNKQLFIESTQTLPLITSEIKLIHQSSALFPCFSKPLQRGGRQRAALYHSQPPVGFCPCLSHARHSRRVRLSTRDRSPSAVAYGHKATNVFCSFSNANIMNMNNALDWSLACCATTAHVRLFKASRCQHRQTSKLRNKCDNTAWACDHTDGWRAARYWKSHIRIFRKQKKELKFHPNKNHLYRSQNFYAQLNKCTCRFVVTTWVIWTTLYFTVDVILII